MDENKKSSTMQITDQKDQAQILKISRTQWQTGVKISKADYGQEPSVSVGVSKGGDCGAT